MRLERRQYKRRKLGNKKCIEKKSENYLKKFLFYIITLTVGFAMWGAQQNTLIRSNMLLQKGYKYAQAAERAPSFYYQEINVLGKSHKTPNGIMIFHNTYDLMKEIRSISLDVFDDFDVEEYSLYYRHVVPMVLMLHEAVADGSCDKFKSNESTLRNESTTYKVEIEALDKMDDESKNCLFIISRLAERYEDKEFYSVIRKTELKGGGFTNELFSKAELNIRASRITWRDFIAEFVKYFRPTSKL